ncbi:MAG: MFS transporter [Promethearchaeota archaeon]
MESDGPREAGQNGRKGDPDGGKAGECVTTKLGTFIENFQRNSQELSKKLGRRLRDVLKDIEIQRKEFLILLLVGLSTGSIIILTVKIFLEFYSPSERALNLGGNGVLGSGILGIGVILGIVSSTILVDRVERRFRVIVGFLIFSGVSLGFYRLLRVNQSVWVSTYIPNLVVLINGFIISSLMVILITLTVEYTKILERGRVFALVLSTSSVVTLTNYILVAADFDFVAVIIPVTAAVYLYLNRDEEKVNPRVKLRTRAPPAPRKVKPEKRLNLDLLKYTAITALYALICGLLLPNRQLEESIQRPWLELDVVLVISVSLFLAFVTAFLTGYSYDFFGRRFTISIMMLFMGIVNFTRFFEVSQTQNIPLMVALLTSLIIAVPLIVGDFTREVAYGRIIALEFNLVVAGFISGIILQRFFSQEFTLALSSLSVVLVLFVLANTQRRVSGREAMWPESLYHLYVIHESGIVVFEHSFREEDLVESDLVGGGIVGTLSMLKEISRGKKHLRTIDHGDKKFMFRYSEDGHVIFVLTIAEDLVILRNKLYEFSRSFESRFGEAWRLFKGVKPEVFEGGGRELVNEYFTRKFFPIFSKSKNFNSNSAERGNNRSERE